jgi:hypothetical protein
VRKVQGFLACLNPYRLDSLQRKGHTCSFQWLFLMVPQVFVVILLKIQAYC